MLAKYTATVQNTVDRISEKKGSFMRENMTRAEIGGPITVEFYAPLLDDAKADELCSRVETIEGVRQVTRVKATTRGSRDTYRAVLALDVIDRATPIYYRVVQVVDVFLTNNAA